MVHCLTETGAFLFVLKWFARNENWTGVKSELGQFWKCTAKANSWQFTHVPWVGLWPAFPSSKLPLPLQKVKLPDKQSILQILHVERKSWFSTGDGIISPTTMALWMKSPPCIDLQKRMRHEHVPIYSTTYIFIYILYQQYIYIYTVKMKVRMPPRIPYIPPPQLECGTRTAKNHSVRMPPHPGFKFFVVFGKLFAQIPHLKCLHTMNIIKCWNAVRMLPLEIVFYQHFSN